MNGRLLALVLLGLTATGCATATPEPATQPAPAAQAAPSDTAAWLELQRAGNYQGKPNPLPGDAAARAYERHLKSFETPIPPHFETGSSSWN